jgi:hypothetical protein
VGEADAAFGFFGTALHQQLRRFGVEIGIAQTGLDRRIEVREKPWRYRSWAGALEASAASGPAPSSKTNRWTRPGKVPATRVEMPAPIE